ncbi:unnamed protein product [Rotaria sordida]|uniref:EF-hand domain-containing protein n=1 Tax=Rotaria sordida TaxID=392033 RepID=A0A814GTG6_9BILA|nr:unnamed protein product [Rotaria sordida]
MGNEGAKKGPLLGLKPKQIAMLKTNTEYTEKDIQEWHDDFLRSSPTGELNKKQFIDMYKKFYRNRNADAYCSLVFSTFDTNDDGMIDFNEFLLAVAATFQGSLDDRLDVAFDICDTSGDNKITQEELATMISATYDLLGQTNRIGYNDPKERAAKIISILDANRDRKLSKNEFINGCKNDPILRRLLTQEI